MTDKVELLKKIESYRASHPNLEKLTSEQLISIMVEENVITLSDAQKISVFGIKPNGNTGDVNLGNSKMRTIILPSGSKIVIKDRETKYYTPNGLEQKKTDFEMEEGIIDVRPSGRYSVAKDGKVRYYAADGKELNEKYFKQVESSDTKITLSDGKTYNLNAELNNRINKVASDLEKAEDNNGFIGKGWNWFKNTTGIGDSSDDVRVQQEAEKKLLAQFNSNEQKRPEIFKELTGFEYTPENLEKFIKGEIKLKSEHALAGYKEGQEMASDVTGDIVSGIAAFGIYTVSVAAAPFTAGASIAVGVAAATASGALIKAGVKAADTIGTDREYTLKEFKHDAVTGGFSGVLAPLTAGLGGAFGRSVATKLGIQAIKQTGKAAAEQGAKSGLKTALLNPAGYEYIGGNALKRGAVLSAEITVDSAGGGAIDNAFRTAYDGGGAGEVLQAGVEGFAGGLIMAGGMKGIGKAFNRIKGIDEFSSIVSNCKNLSDDDLLNLYQYYKNYEQECIKNNKPVPDMKQAGFDKLMNEANSRFGDITPDNIDFARELLANKDFPRELIADVLYRTNEDKIDFASEMVKYKESLCDRIADVLYNTTSDNLELISDMVTDKDFPRELIADVLYNTKKDNIDFARELVADKQFPRDWIAGALATAKNKESKDFAHELGKIKEFPRYLVGGVLYNTNKNNLDFARELVANKEFPKDGIAAVLEYTTKDNLEAARELVANKEFSPKEIASVLRYTTKDNLDYARELVANKDFPREWIANVLSYTNKDNLGIARELLTDKEFIPEQIVDVLSYTNKDNLEAARDMIADKEFPRDKILAVLDRTNKDNLEAARDMIADKEFPREWIASVLSYTNKDNIYFTRKLVADKDFPRDRIAKVLNYTKNRENRDFAYELCKDKKFPCEQMVNVLIRTNNKDKLDFARELVADKEFPRDRIADVLRCITKDNLDFALDLCKNYKKRELQPERIPFLIKNSGQISYKDLQKLNRAMGRDKVAKLSTDDLIIACNMSDIYGKTNINEIPMEGKQNLLRKLVACNKGLFNISDDLKKDFPLIPTDTETYCSLLPAIVKSLGVDIRTIEPSSKIKEFNTNLETLSNSVAKLSDGDFASLDIKLDYSKDEFITNVLDMVKDLSSKERQKMYDYFGFELHKNKNNPTGFSIIGYPINLNNGKKLAEITNPKTKAVVERLRPEVIKFSEQNKIKCNNPDVQSLLNDIVDVLPEIRTQIGKAQHKTHDYDVFKHSLKVMQKITQDPKFQTLNESDKKLMMLASLLHDITKGEGYSDKTHAAQGSFDTFFIAKKFNLTPEEEIKLYTLTRHHEWLEYVNTAKSEIELTKRLQSVAYDLQHDNLFDMALMFTHADLRAVKADDSFHDTKIGKSRIDFKGNVRSFGESADVYAQRIRNYIEELQKSQPLLPVTKIPKSDRINSAITKVNPDGSTNIKGVYKRADGLVVIKFNEVDDWEAIGFPKGSVSKGYMAQAGNKAADGSFAENVNTGNIKFFVHGLDYENQLAKFDAFSLIDSDVLLSVSYAERPESKYRFFRPKGVLLDFDTKYIHGGGNTDSGSGCGKFIENFKEDYIFGGSREEDRHYVSNLIKNATGMSDEDYVKFVEINKNKDLTEIEPAEYREPIIKALAAINSNTRKGGRSYNEMYGSNPKEVMGVFAYDTNAPSNVDNPLDFLLRRQDTEFLQKYALEHDIPFVVFGD